MELIILQFFTKKYLASDPSGHRLNRNYWNHAFVLDPLLGISTVQLRLMILKILFHQ